MKQFKLDLVPKDKEDQWAFREVIHFQRFGVLLRGLHCK
jgi:hypothetical protein